MAKLSCNQATQRRPMASLHGICATFPLGLAQWPVCAPQILLITKWKKSPVRWRWRWKKKRYFSCRIASTIMPLVGQPYEMRCCLVSFGSFGLIGRICVCAREQASVSNVWKRGYESGRHSAIINIQVNQPVMTNLFVCRLNCDAMSFQYYFHLAHILLWLASAHTLRISLGHVCYATAFGSDV